MVPLTEEEKVGLVRLKPEIVSEAAKAELEMKEAIDRYHYTQDRLDRLKSIERNGLAVPLESTDAFLFLDIQRAATPDGDPEAIEARQCSYRQKEAQEYLLSLEYLGASDEEDQMVKVARAECRPTQEEWGTIRWFTWSRIVRAVLHAAEAKRAAEQAAAAAAA